MEINEMIREYENQSEVSSEETTAGEISANSDFCMAVCCEECCSCCRSMTYH